MLSADLVNKGNEPVAFPIAFLPRRHTPLTAGVIQFRTRNTSGGPGPIKTVPATCATGSRSNPPASWTAGGGLGHPEL